MFRFSSPRKLAGAVPSLPYTCSLIALAPLAAFALGLTGCAVSGTSVQSPAVTPLKLSGRVQGGQQPVAGAQIALYAAGKTGTASAARSMLTSNVVTDANGGFSISGLYTCQPGDQVYLVATGGNAGSGSNNAIAMMTALGPCSTLLANAATAFISVNEVTTVASVFSLAPFMTGVTNLGSDTAGSNALPAAFASVATLADTASGATLAISTGNGIVPQATINSLANSLAACVNSTQGSSTCANLFSSTTASGASPADTLQAALNVAHSPATNAAAIYSLAAPAPPFQPALSSAPASFAISVAHPSDVLTYHFDNTRAGVQPAEKTLTPTNVNSTQFGKKNTFPVDATLFAQPLYVGGVGMPDGAVHNLLLAATTHATVYAFDADGSNPGAGYLWKVSLLPAGERFAVAADYGGCTNPPEAGIVGTPVIDRASGTMYLVTKTITSSGGTFSQRLHALSLLDGSERTGSPQLINLTFSGAGVGSANGSIPFNAQRQLNRAALMLTSTAGGTSTLWVAFASHCDIGPYHGIVLGYDPSDLAQPTNAFNNTPNGNDGGIWLAAGGLAADTQGFVYAVGGNGTFDANTGGADYGDSALKLTPAATGAQSTSMTVADYFTPSNQANLQGADLDLGGNEAILFSDTGSGSAQQRMIASDKNGYIYLLDTGSMGHYRSGTHGIDSLNADIQDWKAGGEFIANFAFFNNTLYTSTPLDAYTYVPASGSTAGHFNTSPSATVSLDNIAPVVSANGTTNGILWVADSSNVMHAYSTPTLIELYNTTQAANSRDNTAGFVKFSSPVIANGKVYLGGSNAVVVYGLLP